MKRRIALAVLAAIVAFGLAPVRATDEHTYDKDEYGIIRDGLSPDRKMSLASHGDGDGGNENFHVWLMSEPAHRRIARLAGIGPEGILDTGPNAYHASWSADSRHAAVIYRSDRHIAELNLYEIAGGRAVLMSGPSLFKDVTSREPSADDDLRTSYPEFEWKGTRRFLLKEHRLFLTTDAGFARMLGRYGRAGDDRGDGGVFVEFSAEADCVLVSGHHYRIVDLRIGKFDE
jgi:hypothetical protein